MIPRFGIDTSILLRLVTGQPGNIHRAVVDRLVSLVRETDAAVFASSHVIGESYLALKHCYGVADEDAREAIRSVLTSGLVAPVGGPAVTTLLKSGGIHLIDRLVIENYARHGLRTLTQEAPVAHLDGALRLRSFIDPLDPSLPESA